MIERLRNAYLGWLRFLALSLLLFTNLSVSPSAAYAESSPPQAPAASTALDPVAASDSIRIPFSKRVPQVDGNCDPFEYYDALQVPFIDGGNGTGQVYLKHDRVSLYVCMQAAQGTYPDRFASVYLDPDNRREPAPSTDEYSLRVGITSNEATALQGSSAGFYGASSASGWTASAQTGIIGRFAISPSDQAEFQIPLSMVSPCGGPFSLAIFHHWFAGISNDYGWPQSQYWDVPSTWAEADLAGASNQTCTYFPSIQR